MPKRFLNLPLPGFLPAALGLLLAGPSSLLFAQGASGGMRVLEPGQPPVAIHATVWQVEAARSARPTKSNNLYYHGGTNDSGAIIGVETAPKVYLVFWGSQWNNNDPSGEASILQSFLSNVGNTQWLSTVTQYCQGVASGAYFCNGAGTPAGNQSGMLAGYWYDNASTAPASPTQSQIAAEAVKAAAHFGNTSAASNASVQYVIATATGNNSSGFGTQYCAWHSSTTSAYGGVAYTNLPYITDAGSSCGANFNNLGYTAGITIVEGHEFAETITDQFPNSGWLDSSGYEIGDKCAWNSTTANETLNAVSYPVQPLWSNLANNGSGGCVQ